MHIHNYVHMIITYIGAFDLPDVKVHTYMYMIPEGHRVKQVINALAAYIRQILSAQGTIYILLFQGLMYLQPNM